MGVNIIPVGAHIAPYGGVGNGITYPNDVFRLGFAVHRTFDASSIDNGSYPNPSGLNVTIVPKGDFTNVSLQGRVLTGAIITVLAGSATGDMKGTSIVYGLDTEVYASDLGAGVILPQIVGAVFQTGFWKNGAADGTGTITNAISAYLKAPGRYNGAAGGSITTGETARIVLPGAGVTNKYGLNVMNNAENATLFSIDGSGQPNLFGGNYALWFNPTNVGYTAFNRAAGAGNNALISWPVNTPIVGNALKIASITTNAGVDTITLTWG